MSLSVDINVDVLNSLKEFFLFSWTLPLTRIEWVWFLFNLSKTVRLILPFVYVLGFKVWLFVIYFTIFGYILKKRVSFRKLKISSGLVFLKRSFKLLVWKNFSAILSQLVTIYENVFDCEEEDRVAGDDIDGFLFQTGIQFYGKHKKTSSCTSTN